MELLKITTLLVLLATLAESQICFKKYVERKNRCKGPIRRGKYESASKCCSSKKGVGFAIKREKKGKNLYMCTPCTAFDKKPETHQQRPQYKPPPSENRVTKPVPPGWTDWGACSVSCGAGWRSRVKLCEGCVSTDPRNMQIHPCIEKYYCPVDGNWGPWYPWQACSASCGGGKQTRFRHCNYPQPSHGGKNCNGKADGERECNQQGCPVDGGWGEWSRFSQCSVTCGRGTITRTRLCNNPEPSSGGRECLGSRFEQKRCSNRLCPVNGGWSLWGDWSSCSVTCGTGIRTRSRKCDSPRPRYGGHKCVGEEKGVHRCKNNRPCAVNGGWTSWTSYTPCNAQRCTGKTGERIRTRSCTNPRPRFGGRYCKGPLFSSIECISNNGCPVDGSWCRWSQWSPCIATCKSQFNHLAYERRERTCACPLSKNGGKRCDSDGSTGFQVRECVGVPLCPGRRGVLPEQKSKSGCKKDITGSGDGSDISCDQEDDSLELWSGSGDMPQTEVEGT